LIPQIITKPQIRPTGTHHARKSDFFSKEIT
jgi:hypothetical protein